MKRESHLKPLSFLTILFLFFQTQCGSSKKKISTTDPSPSEKPYCSQVASPSNAVTITGKALYEVRRVSDSGLGAVDSSNPIPIRYAEIIVTDSTGGAIQCGETDGSGQFSLQLQASSTPVTINVNTRGNNNYVKASVLDSPSSMTYYSLTSQVIPNSSKSVSDIVASGAGEILGGAFNIFDQVVKSNDTLRTQTASCATYGCTTFTVAPKVTIYWAKGVNPASYFGMPSTGLSFYTPETDELYILGGMSGDVNNSDTDHFDNSVIVHEYGHFIEDQFSKSDSPGGSHDGARAIDARLAWSEGWADFFQSAVSGNYYYRDTYGNSDCNESADCNGLLIDMEIETCANPNLCDIPTLQGEGNFREFSITRFLWDFIDHPTTGAYIGKTESGSVDSVTASFAELWAAFTGEFASNTHHHRNIGLFHELRAVLQNATTTGISTLLNAEKHDNSQKEYARTLLSGSCSQMSITESNSSYLGVSLTSKHPMTTNDFYQYNHLGGAFTLKLTYSNNPDLALYLYGDGYIYGEGWIGVSDETGDGSTEEISYSNLAAGLYVINVVVKTATSTKTYTLKVNGDNLCPQ